MLCGGLEEHMDFTYTARCSLSVLLGCMLPHGRVLLYAACDDGMRWTRDRFACRPARLRGGGALAVAVNATTSAAVMHVMLARLPRCFTIGDHLNHAWQVPNAALGRQFLLTDLGLKWTAPSAADPSSRPTQVTDHASVCGEAQTRKVRRDVHEGRPHGGREKDTRCAHRPRT